MSSTPPDLGSLEDLQNRAGQAPQQLGQALQNQQQPAQPDPTEQLKASLAQRIQNLNPAPPSGGPIRRLLQNFFAGGSEALQVHLGMPTQQQQQNQLMSQYSNLTNAEGMAGLRQAMAQQYGMVSVPLPDGTQVQMPANSAKTVLAAQARADAQNKASALNNQFKALGLGYRFNPDTQAIEAIPQNELSPLQQSKLAPKPSASTRDDRFIKLSGVDPSTWTNEDRQFMKGYQKYIDVTKTEPGVARAQIFAAPRWAALDPERQAQITTAKSLAAGVFGNQLSSFNALLGHIGDLKDAVGGLNNLDQRFLNTPINRLKLQTGDPQIQAVIAKIEPVRKEFESLLLNNRALYQEDRASADTILSENSSPAQLQVAMKSLAHTAAIRLGAVNSTVKRVSGADIPGILEPASGSVLEEFGEQIPDYQGAGGTFSQSFKSPQGPANRRAPNQGGGRGAAPEGTRIQVGNGFQVKRGGKWVPE